MGTQKERHPPTYTPCTQKCTHTYTHAYTCAHRLGYAYFYTHVYIYAYTHTLIHTHIHLCMHTHFYTYLQGTQMEKQLYFSLTSGHSKPNGYPHSDHGLQVLDWSRWSNKVILTSSLSPILTSKYILLFAIPQPHCQKASHLHYYDCPLPSPSVSSLGPHCILKGAIRVILKNTSQTL